MGEVVGTNNVSDLRLTEMAIIAYRIRHDEEERRDLLQQQGYYVATGMIGNPSLFNDALIAYSSGMAARLALLKSNTTHDGSWAEFEERKKNRNLEEKLGDANDATSKSVTDALEQKGYSVDEIARYIEQQYKDINPDLGRTIADAYRDGHGLRGQPGINEGYVSDPKGSGQTRVLTAVEYGQRFSHLHGNFAAFALDTASIYLPKDLGGQTLFDGVGSGGREGTRPNDPTFSGRQGAGCIPPGVYKLVPMDNAHLGGKSFYLEPVAGTEMNGRSGICLHQQLCQRVKVDIDGQGKVTLGTSHGCVVVDPAKMPELYEQIMKMAHAKSGEPNYLAVGTVEQLMQIPDVKKLLDAHQVTAPGSQHGAVEQPAVRAASLSGPALV